MSDKNKQKVKKKIDNPNSKFWGLVLIGVAFGIWGGLLPPGGMISNSFLIIIAQLFILAASIYGIGLNLNVKEMIFKNDLDKNNSNDVNTNDEE